MKKILMMGLLLVCILFQDCRKTNTSSNVKTDSDNTSESYKLQLLTCDYEEGILTQCEAQNFRFDINGLNKPQMIEFFVNDQTYDYQFTETTHPKETRSFLYQGSNGQVLLFEEAYEYNAIVHVFEIENEGVYYLGSQEYENYKGNHQYIIRKINNALLIERVQSGNNQVRKVNLFLKEPLNEKTPEKKVDSVTINPWIGKYQAQFEIAMEGKNITFKYDFNVQDKGKVNLQEWVNHQKTDDYDLKVTSVTDSLLNMISPTDSLIAYTIVKSGNDYFLTGKTISLINPPNDIYSMKKK